MRDSSPEKIQRNQKILSKKVTEIFNIITSEQSVNRMPAGMRIIASYFFECAKKYLNGLSPLPFVGGYLMLRFINPALANPDAFGLLPNGKALTPKARRNIVLISKCMQNMSNETIFHTEQYMLPLNPLLTQFTPKLQSFFKNVIETGTSTDSNLVSDTEACVVTVHELHMLHKHLSKLKDEIQKGMTNKSDVQDFEKKMNSLGSYASKVSFASSLKEGEQKFVKELLSSKKQEASYVGLITLPKTKEKEAPKKAIIICGICRIFLLKQDGGKILSEGHLIDLLEVTSISKDLYANPKEIKIVFKNCTIEGTSEQADELISCIRRAYMFSFSSLPTEKRFKLNVQPEIRVEEIPQDPQLCCGFVSTYRAMCDYYQVEPCLQLCWDIENISDKFKKFDFKTFFSDDPSVDEPSYVSSQMAPIFHALKHNTYFTSLSITDKKIEKQALEPLADLLGCNTALQSLTLRNVNANEKIFYPVLEALKANQKCKITFLDLSFNPYFDDKAVSLIGEFIAFSTKLAASSSVSSGINIHESPHGLKVLCLSGSLEAKGVGLFFNSLLNVSKVLGVNLLTSLDVSYCKISEQSLQTMSQCLSVGLPCLKKFNCAMMNIPQGKCAPLIQALYKGTKKLEYLNMSSIKLSKGEETAFLAELISSFQLRKLRLQGCISTLQVLEVVFPALSKPNGAIDVSFSRCDFSQCSVFLKEHIPTLMGVDSIDFSETELGDDGVISVLEGLLLNKSISNVSFDYCWGKPSSKPREQLVVLLSKLASQDCSCPIDSLSIRARQKSNQPLGKLLIPFLRSLSNPSKLIRLNITGQNIGNAGAIVMGRTLLVNNELVELYMDENSLGLPGFTALADALKFNRSLKVLPLPLVDASACLTTATAAQTQFKLSSTIADIESSISQNGST
eukprot:TRINITY_DN50_c0_g2_i2.p1 TRINITY_DN50_c0_g2~~TRINITY_DN50_c0_g2_i2.p1  ORF type:complete len:906 (-),score=256.34 TRINITY_DN50_c0_g2_i2:381-3098(-)